MNISMKIQSLLNIDENIDFGIEYTMSKLYPIIDAYLEKARFIRIDLILRVETRF